MARAYLCHRQIIVQTRRGYNQFCGSAFGVAFGFTNPAIFWSKAVSLTPHSSERAVSTKRAYCSATRSVIFRADSTLPRVAVAAGRFPVLRTTPPVKLGFFCDTSSLRDSQFMVAAGVALRLSRYRDLAQSIQDIKDAAKIESEIKWASYKGGGRKIAYKGIIDLFYSLIQQDQIHFHCIIAEFGKFQHKAFSGGSPETSANRMYYQLLVHRVLRFYSRKAWIYIYPDMGGDCKDLEKFHGSMMNKAHIRYRVPHRLVCIEARDSELCNVVQMVDLIAGGIAYARNKREQQSKDGAHKAELAAYILKSSKLSSWSVDTAHNERKFTVWNFRHQQWDFAPRSARRFERHG